MKLTIDEITVSVGRHPDHWVRVNLNTDGEYVFEHNNKLPITKAKVALEFVMQLLPDDSEVRGKE